MVDWLPVKLNLNVDVKPSKETIDKIVVALLDTVSPVTETTGLVGDIVKYRRKVLALVFAQTIEKLQKEKKLFKMPEPKFMLEFADKASRENLESKLIDAWANLLKEASTDFDSIFLTFTQILSELGSKEARVLEEIVGENVYETRMASRLLDIFETQNESQIKEALPLEFPQSSDPIKVFSTANVKEISNNLRNLDLHGPTEVLIVQVPCQIDNLIDGKKRGEFTQLTSTSDFYNEKRSSIDIFKRNGLMEVYERSFFLNNEKEQNPFVFTLARITPMGLDFLAACQGIYNK